MTRKLNTLHDQHLHSRFSADSQADPEAVCRAAVERGLRGITFTEHYDSHPDEWGTCVWDYDRIAASVARLRQRFAGTLTINLGIEICYQPANMPAILDYLRNTAFDCVLLSIHWCAGKPVHVREAWQNLGPADMIRAYLETVLEAVLACEPLLRTGERPFDVLGHLDLAKRYTQRYWGGGDLRAETELIDRIWRAVLAVGIVPEVNTSSLRQGVGETMPAPWMIERYVELGGRIMSIGSDAHRSEDVGADFDTVAAMLKTAGIHSTAVFNGRELQQVPLVIPD